MTFAIDHYLFESRYLVHVGGATKKKDQAAVQDEKAYLHEKEALNIESGQKGSSDGDRSLKPKSEDVPNVPMSTARPRWTLRGFYILLLLFVINTADRLNVGVEIPVKSKNINFLDQ